MQNKRMNFRGLAFALIFLCNPNISIIDPLPDFIGYIIISLSLVKFADMNDTLCDSLTVFKRLILIDAAKILAIFWTFGMTLPNEKSTSLLLWSFVFGVLEVIFVNQAFSRLFSGIASLGTVCENTSVLGGGKRSYTGRIKALTFVFITFKALMCVLPESSVLGINEDGFSMYRFIGVMRFLAFIPVIIVGIVWLIKGIRYFVRVNRDKPFIDGINDLYRERVLTNKSIFIKRDLKICYVLLICAFAFGTDVRIDYVNILPDLISAVFFVAFFAIAAKHVKLPKLAFISASAVLFVISAFAWFSEYSFFDKYYYEAIYRSDEAYAAYMRSGLAAGIGTILFAVASFCVIFTMYQIIQSHTGLEKNLDAYNDEKYKEIDTATKKELSFKLLYCILASLICIASNVWYIMYSADYGILTTVDIAAGIVCMLTYMKVYSDIIDAVDNKYILG